MNIPFDLWRLLQTDTHAGESLQLSRGFFPLLLHQQQPEGQQQTTSFVPHFCKMKKLLFCFISVLKKVQKDKTTNKLCDRFKLSALVVVVCYHLLKHFFLLLDGETDCERRNEMREREIGGSISRELSEAHFSTNFFALDAFTYNTHANERALYDNK